MPISGFDLNIWIAGVLGEIILLLVLLLRGRSRDFPIFTVFLFSELLKTFVGMFVKDRFSFETYQHYFWSAGILDECLQLFVMYEIAAHVFAPMGQWAADVRRTMITMVGVSAVLSALLSLLASPATRFPIQGCPGRPMPPG
jgi:hypothetical protein